VTPKAIVTGTVADPWTRPKGFAGSGTVAVCNAIDPGSSRPAIGSGPPANRKDGAAERSRRGSMKMISCSHGFCSWTT
jgi:hypothetical protein